MNARSVSTNIPRLLALLVAIHIVEILLVAGVLYALDLQARASLSARLGIDPNWSSFEKYIEGQFTVGMTHKEVIDRAEAIGAFSVHPYYLSDKYCEIFFFNVGPFQSSRGGSWDICYDENNKVIYVLRYRYQ